jgi:hypothetical protein
MKVTRFVVALVAILVPLSAFADNFPSASDYIVMHGKVTIGTIGDRMIGVLVDPRGEGGEASPYRHLFRLWSETPLQAFQVTSSSASIEYRGDELVILAADKQLFYILNIASSQTHELRAPNAFGATRYVGYGLNHEIRAAAAQKNGRGGVTATLDDCPDFGDCFFNKDYDTGGGGSGGGSCNAGGIYATSCSISNSHGSCSINCSGSSYACCTAATSTTNAFCRCI